MALISPQYMQVGQMSFLIAYTPLVWAGVVLALYPLCRANENYKFSHP